MWNNHYPDQILNTKSAYKTDLMFYDAHIFIGYANFRPIFEFKQ